MKNKEAAVEGKLDSEHPTLSVFFLPRHLYNTAFQLTILEAFQDTAIYVVLYPVQFSHEDHTG